jgi:hypothetical protein
VIPFAIYRPPRLRRTIAIFAVHRNTNPTIPETNASYLLPPAEIAPPGRLMFRDRLVIAGGGVVLLAVLAVSSLLTPSTQGFGTHRQLGLPDCSMVAMFGIRCPGCGMTTSWAHVMHGNIEGALNANVGGTMLCGLSILCAPIMIGMGALGRTSRGGWFSIAAISGLCIAMAVSVVEWVIRLASHG